MTVNMDMDATTNVERTKYNSNYIITLALIFI